MPTLDTFWAADLTAVYICTHHDTHAAFAMRAAGMGLHIFLEKPMALTEADARSICQAVDAANVLCMTGFKMRYYGLVQKAKSLISQPLLLSAQIIDRRWPDDSWANDPVKGGGNVLSQGCHAVDLLVWLANSKPVRISAQAANLHHRDINIIDALAMTITFESGAIGSLLVGDMGQPALTDKLYFGAMDGIRTVQLDDRLKRLSFHDGENPHTFSVAMEDGFLHENKEFLNCLQTRRQPSSTHLEGFRATMLLLRAIEASNRGAYIDVSDLYSHHLFSS
jgi:predicted dehydrogenase